MKKWIFSIVLLSAFGLIGYAEEKSPEAASSASSLTMVELYACQIEEHKITVQSDNGLVAVIDAPKGSWVGISGTMTSEHGAKTMTFKGDVIVRLRRADEVEKSEGTNMKDIMSKAPFELHLKNSTVTMESVK